ncbi:carboxypeptidase-like regulatory domain-containing protein [Autumnicola musiva]|uniref:Carboxypeptidase-like regulatory domain-containing protein n=1 Tax=Autumnicola musiva TaxID=3075589 RepID=A0ABU3D9A7_9FLAO|nr:carboxypeptidase-like regulatory domain-containing protein [Zunongwangia sp. F117]MDT0678119.1 carboxypeptidase-like regulatory domain-containing protein [Zunongwangia sp. F117]
MLKTFILSLLFVYVNVATSQEKLRGIIYNAEDSTAVFGASVYFDGTSIGVSSNKDGTFALNKPSEILAPLVISSLGFETVVIKDYDRYTSYLPPVYLKPGKEQLATVNIEADPWSREKKLKIFRREFIGSTKEAKDCFIENEEVVKLTYRPSTEVLTAYSNEPLNITNKYLGYQVKYNLQNFKIQFSIGTSGIQFTHFVYYDGTSFFQELKEKTKRKILRHRKRIYNGSILQFMRSLATKDLENNNFDIYHDRYKVPPYKYIKLSKRNNLVEVKLLTDKIIILHKNKNQSAMSTEGTFVIDALGNHSPPQNVIFSGVMSNGRTAHLLPLDYQQ